VPIRFLLPLALLFGLAVGLPLRVERASAESRSSRPDTMDVKDIKPGMKGYGLTVFEGTQPEKFAVEVIDVLRNFRPRQDLVLVKTQHPRLEVAKVVAGMSGSPIYLDGKMIGAYAYGWTFGAEPIAGVTPIGNMLDDLARPLPNFVHGWPTRVGGRGSDRVQASAEAGHSGLRYSDARSGYDLARHRDEVQAHMKPSMPAVAGVAPVSTPVLLGGMTPRAVEIASDLLGPLGLEPLAGGGGAVMGAETAPERYVDGGAIGIQLISGDTTATGLGTVTRVEGDLVSAFGHPMMSAGFTALPAAVSKVLWFLASQQRSFKIGAPVRDVGALVNDRQASIVVSHSAKAPVIPVRVRISGSPGAPFTDWNFTVAHEKFMAPSFLAVAIGSALQATANERSDVTWSAESTVRFKNYGEVTVEDFGVAVGGTPEPGDFIRSNLVNAVGAVLNNPWENAFVESVEVTMKLSYAREVYRLRGVELLDAEVEPGQAVRMRLALEPFSGRVVEKLVSVELPRHLAGEKVKIEVRPGFMVEKPKASPESLAELIGTLEDVTYPPRTIVLSYDDGEGVGYRGQVVSNLPPGVIDRLAPESTTMAPEVFRASTHKVEALPYYMLGKHSVRVQVKDSNE
jgi:SpoIVB peptidase S55